MRDFFIRSFEVLVGIIVVLLGLGVLIAAGIAAMGGSQLGPGMSGGPLTGLAILVGGAIYVTFIGGLMYLGLGIYQNTKRTAEAVERMVTK